MDEIKIGVIDDGKITVLEFSGYIDSGNYSQARDRVEEIIKSGKARIIVDMSGVTYMGSAGWGIFVGNIKSAREKHGDIKLAAMQEEVKSIYELVEFDEILPAYDTVEEAKKSFNS